MEQRPIDVTPAPLTPFEERIGVPFGVKAEPITIGRIQGS
jgi:hypothetical protein